MLQFVFAMYIAQVNGLYIPMFIQIGAWVILFIQFMAACTKKR